MRAPLAAVIAFASAGCGGGPLAPSPAPPPAATRDGRWIQDIEQLARDLPRLHTNLFFQVSRDGFEREVDALKADVPRLGDHEIVVGLMRVAALVGDGHTSVGGLQWSGFGRLPLRLRWLADGLTVTHALPGALPALGARVVRAGELDVNELLARVTRIVAHDNDAAVRAFSSDLLAVPEVLHALGAAEGATAVTLGLQGVDGARFDMVVPAVPRADLAGLVDATLAAGNGLPLYRQRPQDVYWYTRIEAADILYLQYNRCQNGAEPMSVFARRFLQDVDERPPRAVVIDLRANQGGDSSVAEPLLQGLRARRYLADSGRLFTIIGNATFSSALMNSVALERDAGAILVGEPTGGRPNHYGQVSSFVLPNSGLTVYYSTRYFRLLPDADPAALFPDVPAAPTAADYVAGRDLALEAIEARAR